MHGFEREEKIKLGSILDTFSNSPPPHRIEHLDGKYSFDFLDKKSFVADSIPHLLAHYADPATHLIFEPKLFTPIRKMSPFSLRELCR